MTEEAIIKALESVGVSPSQDLIDGLLELTKRDVIRWAPFGEYTA